jgi:predicted RNase H-like HicB family nuclease/DNA-binding XRE family transcriptional regulator
MEYVAKVSRSQGQWAIEFPDCEGCVTCGTTKEEARMMAAEALAVWLESRLENGHVPPRPKYANKKGWAIAVDVATTVALQLRWVRDERGLTQGQVAKLAGVTQQQVARLERTTSNPTVKTLEVLARALGMRFNGAFEIAKSRTA